MLTEQALQKLRDFIIKTISYGRFRIDSTFHTVPIHKTEIKDGVVYVYLLVDHNVVGTVNRFELFSRDQQLFAEKPDNITKNDLQGILVRFAFTIKEV